MGPYHFGAREVSGVTVPAKSPPLNPALVVPASVSGKRKQAVQPVKTSGSKTKRDV